MPIDRRRSVRVLPVIWPYRRHALTDRIASGKHTSNDGSDAGTSIIDVFPSTLSHPSVHRLRLRRHAQPLRARPGRQGVQQTAPIIKLPADATEDDHLALLGLLNSSTACFWMKQVFHTKGSSGIGGGHRRRAVGRTSTSSPEPDCRAFPSPTAEAAASGPRTRRSRPAVLAELARRSWSSGECRPTGDLLTRRRETKQSDPRRR